LSLSRRLRAAALSGGTAEAPPTAGTLILRCALHAAIPVLRRHCLSAPRSAKVARPRRGRPTASAVERLPRHRVRLLMREEPGVLIAPRDDGRLAVGEPQVCITGSNR